MENHHSRKRPVPPPFPMEHTAPSTPVEEPGAPAQWIQMEETPSDPSKNSRLLAACGVGVVAYLAVVVCSLLLLWTPKLKDIVEAHRTDAVSAMNRGESEVALLSLDKLLALSPDDAGAVNMRARCLMMLDRFDAAIDAYQFLLTLEFDDGDGIFLTIVHRDLGDLYQKLGNLELAASHYQLALEASATDLGRAFCHGDLGLVALARTDEESARHHFEQAYSLDPDLEFDKNMGSFCRGLYSGFARPEQSVSVLRKAVAIATAMGWEERSARFYSEWSFHCRNAGDLDAAEDHLWSSLRSFESVGNNEAVCGVYDDLGKLYRFRGEFARATECHEESLQLSLALNYDTGIAIALSDLGDMMMIQSDASAAESNYRAALSIFESDDNVRNVAILQAKLGNLCIGRGEVTEAEYWLSASLDGYLAIGDPDGIASGHLELCRLKKVLGDLDGAEAHVRSALDSGRFSEDGYMRALALDDYAEILAARGELDEALCYYEEACGLIVASGEERHLVVVYSNMAELYDSRGDYAGSDEYTDRLLDYVRAVEFSWAQGAALSYEGQRLSRDGNWDEAERRFAESSEKFAEGGMVRGQMWIKVYLAEIAAKRGNLDAAEALIREALECNIRYQVASLDIWASGKLGHVLRLQGQLDEAAQLLADGLLEADRLGYRQLALELATDLAEVRLDQGDRAGTRELLQRALKDSRFMGLLLRSWEIESRLEDLALVDPANAYR